MPDTIPNNRSTTNSIGLNGTFSSNVDTSGDRDWVRISMTEGQAVQINMNGTGGNPMSDTFVRVYD